MARDKTSSKDVMKPHSEAKVRFYQKYLDTHLQILSSIRFAKEIHIYDLFCGRGIYKDGKKGSAILAYETIREVREKRPSNKKIVLHLNDKKRAHIEAVRNYIETHYDDETKPCEVQYTTEDADNMLASLASEDWKGKRKECIMNVFFIDPYGYKQIKREFLELLMDYGYTEILLFLPISFMHRFTRHAFSPEATPGTVPLRKLIVSFFPETHPMRIGTEMDVQTYIDYLTEAFSCDGKFYTTSYPIERNENNQFALFFFSTSIFGYEQVMNLKWKMIDSWGFGFHLPEIQGNLFGQMFRQERLNEITEMFRTKLLSFMSGAELTNGELYVFTVENGYLPKHAKDVLRDLQKSGHLQIMDIETGALERRKNQFRVDYDGYRKPSYLFKLI